MSERRMVETDYVLDVVCGHMKNVPIEPTPPRVVSRIYHVNPPESGTTHGFLEWREAEIEEAPNYPSAMQTYFDELRRRGVPLGAGVERERDAVRDLAAQRWRFWCSDCNETLPVAHAKMAPILAGLRDRNLPRVTFAGLAAIVQE